MATDAPDEQVLASKRRWHVAFGYMGVIECALIADVAGALGGSGQPLLNGASVGGVDDQHVGLGPVGEVGWDRSQQPPGDGAESDVPDNQQVGVDVLGQIH